MIHVTTWHLVDGSPTHGNMCDKIYIPLHTEMKDLLIPVVSASRARRLRAVVLPPELPPMPERPTPQW